MRPAKVSQFMKWRDEQPEYLEVLRRVLRLSEEAEALEAEGVEEHPTLDEWRQARGQLLLTEEALLARFGGPPG